MKANELMIGDWVIVHHPTMPAEGIQISADWLRTIELINNGLIKEDSPLFRIVEPIPLTVEILEKNGFKKIQIHGEKQDNIFQCYDGEITIEVGIYDPNCILIHYRYETPDGINSGELSSIIKVDGGKFYLHELQHALRLCGIEKEIIL